MAKSFITAHIKIEDYQWAYLARHAQNNDLTTAQLVRKILRGWLDSQVLVSVGEEITTMQRAGRRSGFDPHGNTTVGLEVGAE